MMGENLTIESVSEKVSSTRQKLDDLKRSINALSDKEKAKKTQELVALRGALDESKKELGKLKHLATEEADKMRVSQIESEISQMETEYQQLDSEISKQLSLLSQDIQAQQSKKGRLATQREGLTSKDEWKNHTGKNIARTLGGVGLVGGAVRLGKKIFGKKKKKESSGESEGGKSGGEEKGFRQKPFGKFLKGTAITAGIAGAVYGFGKWIGWWGTEGATGRDSDPKKYESYDTFAQKPENQEKFHNYESLGDKVDNVYEQIYGKELQSGYEDELEMKRISVAQSKSTKYYKGIVPYCLDNQYRSVEGILGQNSSFRSALSDGLQGMVDFVKNAGTGFLQLFVDNYIKFLPSWKIFNKAAGSLSEKLDKWKIENQEAEKEMQYFFRQSIRIQTYLFQKKDQLTKKLVKDASQKYGISESEIWNDDDKFNKYVTNDPQYQNFINSPTHSAVTVLSQNNLFDTTIDEDLKKLVSDIDNDRDRVLGCKKGEKDIIETINEKKIRKQTLDVDDDKKLGDACDGVIGDMDNIIEAAEDSAWNVWGDLLRAGDANLREYLEKSGLDKMFLSLKQKLLELRQSLKNGQLSNDQKIALAEILNSVMALKKEALLGEYTVTRDYDEYGNIIYRIPGFLIGSVKNIYKGFCKFGDNKWVEGYNYITTGLMGPGAIVTVGGIVYAVRSGKTGWVKAGIVMMGGPFSLPLAGACLGARYIRPVRELGHKMNIFKYKGKKGAEVLLSDLYDGRLSLDRAGKIIHRRTSAFFGSGETQKLWKEAFNVSSEGRSVLDTKRAVFDALVQKRFPARYVTELQGDSKLYDEVIKNWDVSKELRNTVRAKKPLDEVRRVTSSISNPVEVLSDARKAFNASIDKSIAKLHECVDPKLQNETFKWYINKLEALKSDKNLADEEAQTFVKMLDDGFDVKLLPDLRKLLETDDVFKEGPRAGKKIGSYLKKLISEGKYAEFRTILTDNKLTRAFKKIPVERIVTNLDKALKWTVKMGTKSIDLFKSFGKILSKLF